MRRVRDLIEQTGEIALPLEEHVGAFCRDIADNVGADLISIWRFDSDRTRIACEAFYDVATGEFSRGQILYATDHPIYFRGILEEQVIDAPDVYTHPLTKDLIDTYFAPHGIKSLLDFIVHRDFKPVGIICCESRGIPRQWTEADIAYLRQIATLASFALPWD